MKEILVEIINRLEQLNLMLSQHESRLAALELSFDGSAPPEVVRARLAVLQERSNNADSYRQAILSLHEDLQQLLAKVPD